MEAPTGPQPIHTAQDDMESLLYVVLYSSLLWIPHNRTGNHKMLNTTIKQMFDAFNDLGPMLKGGDAKSANATSGTWMSGFKWHTQPLNEWIREVCDLHRQYVSVASERPHHRWTLDALETTWSQFLDKYAEILPSGDREYMLPVALTKDASNTVAANPYEPTQPSDLMSSRKRGIQEVSPGPPQGRAPKRPRQGSPLSLGSDAPMLSVPKLPLDAMLTSEVERRFTVNRPTIRGVGSSSSRRRGRATTSPMNNYRGSSPATSNHMNVDERSSSPTPAVHIPHSSIRYMAWHGLANRGTPVGFEITSTSRPVSSSPQSMCPGDPSVGQLGVIPAPVYAAQGPTLSDWRSESAAPAPHSPHDIAIPHTSHEIGLMSVDQRTLNSPIAARSVVLASEGQADLASSEVATSDATVALPPTSHAASKSDSVLPQSLTTSDRSVPEPITASSRPLYDEWRRQAMSIPQSPPLSVIHPEPKSGRNKATKSTYRDVPDKDDKSSQNNVYSRKSRVRKTTNVSNTIFLDPYS